ncbi:MAG: hypothetical protein K2P14_06970 [Anaeroplasmataceae bacterium]|nr:hypothetical protein [Anaeroplasmataceae bacterium]
MKKKLRLPILLLAVVVMMSIFYIHEANKPTEPVGSPSLDTSTTNPDYAEARMKSIDEVNALISEAEAKIASGTLTVAQIEAENALITSLRQNKINEIALEEMIITSLEFEDVLVLLEDGVLVIDVYTSEELTKETFVKITRLAKEKFDTNYTVKLSATSNSE